MHRSFPFSLLLLVSAAVAAKEGPNPLIDYAGFKDQVKVVGELREDRRISQEEFMLMATDPQTVILDARSESKYRLLHIKGARNLSLPDITEEELARVIPEGDPDPHLLQQQFPQRTRGISYEGDPGVAQRLYDERAPRVWLHQRLRARSADRHHEVEDPVRRQKGGAEQAMSYLPVYGLEGNPGGQRSIYRLRGAFSCASRTSR